MAVRDLIPRFGSRSPVVRSESSHPIMAFHEEMNRLFDDFWRDFDGFGSSLATRSFGFPRIELSETDRELTVEAELPGMDEKEVEVLLDNGVLTLRGERKGEAEDKGRRISERYYGRFERRITLPAEVEEDKVHAAFKNGVLTITMQKSAEAAQKVKRIPISGK
jgi:HSP20 family protein